MRTFPKLQAWRLSDDDDDDNNNDDDDDDDDDDNVALGLILGPSLKCFRRRLFRTWPMFG